MRWFRVLGLAALCLAHGSRAHTDFADECSYLQLLAVVEQVNDVAARAPVQVGSAPLRDSSRNATVAVQDETASDHSNTSIPASVPVPLVEKLFDELSKMGRPGKIRLACLVALTCAILIILCCAFSVLSEDAPALWSETNYITGSGVYDWKVCLLASGFAFVSGWADAICFVRYKAFATMMTGNFFQLGYTMIFPKATGGPGFYAAIICTYFLSALAFRYSQLTFGNRVAIFWGPALALGLFAFEILDEMQHDPFFGHARWIVPFLSPVFAVLNVVSAKGGIGMPCGFASGHFQDLAYGLAQRIKEGSVPQKEQSKLIIKAVIIISVVGGAVSAALCDWISRHTEANLDVSLFPIAPLLGFAFVMHDRMFYKSLNSETSS